jgi:hypothetical protein
MARSDRRGWLFTGTIIRPLLLVMIVIVDTDIWDAGVGYAVGAIPPSPEMTGLVWVRGSGTPTTVDLQTVGNGNLAVAIAPEDDRRPIVIGSIRTISAAGEPAYTQEFGIHLRAADGRCELSPHSVP